MTKYTFKGIVTGQLREGTVSILVQDGQAEVDTDNPALKALADKYGQPEKAQKKGKRNAPKK